MGEDLLHQRARALGLYGVLAHWDEMRAAPWISDLLSIEESERNRRSLERRVKNAKTGRFKAMADFDWAWPKAIDREAVEDLFQFGFADPNNPANDVLDRQSVG